MPDRKRYHVPFSGYSGIRIGSFDPNTHQIPVGDKVKGKTFAQFISEKEEIEKLKGGTFFDDPIVAISMDPADIKVENNHLVFKGVASSYFRFAFSRSQPTSLQAAYVNAVVLTKPDETGEKIVFGSSTKAEGAYLGKLGVPAGGLLISPDGHPSFGAQIYRELGEEIGVNHDLDISRIIPGWAIGASKREGTYHPTFSFVVQLNTDGKQTKEKYEDWRATQKKAKNEPEFGKNLRLLPNDPDYMMRFIKEQDAMDAGTANIQGKSLDVIDFWVYRYGCDISKLKASQAEGSKIELPQPSISDL